MTYEKTPVKELAKASLSKHADDVLEQFSTRRMLWKVVRRHKFGLVLTYAIILSVLQFVPFVPSLVLSYIK